ncbi:MAG: hypothetical protein GC191_09265 [Azospirillum sp.]|nr:hypothetical protein [Azospirillum sp.]
MAQGYVSTAESMLVEWRRAVAKAECADAASLAAYRSDAGPAALAELDRDDDDANRALGLVTERINAIKVTGSDVALLRLIVATHDLRHVLAREGNEAVAATLDELAVFLRG